MRLYDRLFNDPTPDRGDVDFLEKLNPESLTVLEDCRIETSLAQAQPEDRFQFERTGYFVADRYDHDGEHAVYNQTIGLRDSWAG